MRRGLAAAAWVLVVAAGLWGCGQGKPPAETPRVPAAAAIPTGPGTTSSMDGVEIAYTVHRVGTPTVVLVHGWMGNQTYWEGQIPALAERFGVVTVDLAGHGRSGRNRERWTIPSLGDDVRAVITQLDLRQVILAGHSMGGRVALDVARSMPGTVIGVIGVDSLHDVAESRDPQQVSDIFSNLSNDFVGTCNVLVRGMFVPSSDAALVDRITGEMCSGPPDIGAALLRAYVTFDLPAAFAEARVPIRVINSDLWPTNLEGNRAVSEYHAVILKGYGHFLMQEMPQELARLMVEAASAIAAAHPAGSAPAA